VARFNKFVTLDARILAAAARSERPPWRVVCDPTCLVDMKIRLRCKGSAVRPVGEPLAIRRAEETVVHSISAAIHQYPRRRFGASAAAANSLEAALVPRREGSPAAMLLVQPILLALIAPEKTGCGQA
jgi:hypothetical protein